MVKMTAASLEEKVKKFEYIPGPLVNAHSQVVPGTERHAHEVMALRDSRPELRNLWVWTADFPMYRVENGEALLYFAPREHNLIFRDIQNSITQLLATILSDISIYTNQD